MRRRLRLPGRLATGLTLMIGAGTLASPAFAADLGLVGPPYGSSVTIEERRVVTVVPACYERSWAMLLHCMPRGEVAIGQDADLVEIERTMLRARRRPYPEMLPPR